MSGRPRGHEAAQDRAGRVTSDPGTASRSGEDRFVFNVVWTGRVFDQLQLFTSSLLEQTGARLRFIANQCPPDQLVAMERYAERHPGRVVEVVDVSPRVMVRHGDALDTIFRTRDDGEHFCFIDPDICARRPFLAPFEEALTKAAVVTSGRELWAHDNVRPEDHIGVNGEFFFDQDGYTFGSPHLALYRREELGTTMERWGVGFSSAGNDISTAARARLKAVGRDYWIFDTAKIVNVLMQADGLRLDHFEHPDVIHIGGVSHFLAPPLTPEDEIGTKIPEWGHDVYDWGSWDGQAARYLVAGYTAQVLRDLFAGEPASPVPHTVEGTTGERLAVVRTVMTDLVARYGIPERTDRRSLR